MLEWSERQAQQLRQHAAGERTNEPLNWASIIEEIEGTGRLEFHRCDCFLQQLMFDLF